MRDGLLVVTPYYNKPPQDGLRAHFTAVADATGLPNMVYDIPGRAGVEIKTETLIALAEHPRIVAVKDAKGDVAGTTKVLANTDLFYYCGADELNLAWLAIGAVGIASVVAHVASEQYRQLIDAVVAGDLATAQEIDRQMVPAVEAIMTRTQGAIMVKAALKLAGVIEHATTPVAAGRGDRRASGLAHHRPQDGRTDCMSHPHPDLDAPGPLAPGALRVIPLGGLGEVGRNMTVFEYDGKLLIVDCGVLFPDENQPGVDLILPDFQPIRDRLDDIVAVVLTHGHEDHIGGLPYLLRERGDIPVIGSQLTLALLEGKLKEHRHRNVPQQTVVEGESLQIGPFDCEFIAVNHSIPDALAVAIKTPAGLVLHTGDFKMDQLPLDNRITDLRAFARLGEEGVDLFCVDSTNSEVPGFTTHERDIAPVLDGVFTKAKNQRIIVACFASHVHRVQQVMDAAVKHRRKVAYVGRSMVRNMGVARDLGFLNVPGDTLIDMRELDNYPPEQVVLVSTGSQGEPMSALSRIAAKTTTSYRSSRVTPSYSRRR